MSPRFPAPLSKGVIILATFLCFCPSGQHRPIMPTPPMASFLAHSISTIVLANSECAVASRGSKKLLYIGYIYESFLYSTMEFNTFCMFAPYGRFPARPLFTGAIILANFRSADLSFAFLWPRAESTIQSIILKMVAMNRRAKAYRAE
jgi:hypothetical protein